jgi:two-component system response regulator TctD
MHIVILDCGTERTAAAQRSLRKMGHIVSLMEATPEGMDHLAGAAFDLLLLAASNLQAGLVKSLAALRARCPSLAVVAIGASGEDAARCLDAGADLVLPDSCDRDLLVASVVAAVRRARGYACSLLTAGALELDLDTRTCRLKGRPVAVSETEYRLLEALLLRHGTVVTRPMLLELLYEPGAEPQARTLDLFVHRLRWKLAAPRMPALIETRRNGFTITAPAGGVQALAA